MNECAVIPANYRYFINSVGYLRLSRLCSERRAITRIAWRVNPPCWKSNPLAEVTKTAKPSPVPLRKHSLDGCTSFVAMAAIYLVRRTRTYTYARTVCVRLTIRYGQSISGRTESRWLGSPFLPGGEVLFLQ